MNIGGGGGSEFGGGGAEDGADLGQGSEFWGGRGGADFWLTVN